MQRDEASYWRLVWWNRFWAVLWLCSAAAWGRQALLAEARQMTTRLTAHWSGPDLTLRSVSDGPFLVTHLVRYGTPSEADKAVAALPQPLAIIDSGGATIPRDLYRKLVWRNFLGQRVPAPPEGAPVGALYTRPLATNPGGAP